MSYAKFESKKKLLDVSFLEKYLYLFLIDMETEINHHRHYRHYLTSDEKGFTKNTLNAYIEAFRTKQTTLDINTVLKLHQSIAGHLNTPGQYKTSCNKFAVLGKELPNKVTQASATEDGLKEFIDRWILNNPQHTHMLIISPAGAIDNPSYSGSMVGAMGLYNDGGNIRFRRITSLGLIQESYEHKKHLSLIWSALINPDFVCEVNSMPDDLVPEKDVVKLSALVLKELIDTYNKKIISCVSERDKISCIVELAQGVNQLHPFWDGNTRLGILLLNLLLHSRGLSMTLLANPNRLNMFSNAELVQCVIEGQTYFRDLCEGQVPCPYDRWIKQKNYLFTPCFIESSPEQIQQFIKDVICQNYQRAYQKLKIYSLPYSLSLFCPSEPPRGGAVLATELSLKLLHWDDIPDTDQIRFVPELM
jgi:hypothetical protein